MPDRPVASAEVEVRLLKSPDECHEAAALYAEIWGTSPSETPVPGEILVALADSGNYVAGAFSTDGALVGGAAAWFGQDGDTRFLHSHVAGVALDVQGRGIGMALKHHQRTWTLARGIDEIRWTFDPLVRRNAWFNLTRLGAVGVRYVTDHYGHLDDGINAGEPSDRLVVHWRLDRAPEAQPPPGAYPVLDVDRHGEPMISAAPESNLAVWLPDDIVALRHDDPALARRWRVAQRSVLAPALDDGYQATDVTPEGWLILTR